MDHNERKIVLTAGMAHAMAHFYEILFPAMTMYVIDDMALPAPTVIKAGFLLYMLYGLLAPFWGFWADRRGSGRALGVGMMMAGAGAVSAAITHGIAALWISLGLIGIGIASAHPAGMSLISKSVSQRGNALGLFGICGNLGIVMAPLVGGIGGYYIGWRNMMVIAGLLGIATGALSLVLKINEPFHLDKTYTAEIPIKHATMCFIFLCLAMTLAGLIYRANLVTLPVYLEERPTSLTAWLNRQDWLDAGQVSGADGRYKTLGATLLISLAVLVGTIGQKVGGHVADCMDLRWGYFGFFLMGLPALLAMAFLHGWALVLATSFFMIFSLGMQPIENSLVARLTPPKWRSTAYGIKFILTFGVGSLAVWLVSACLRHGNTAAIYKALSLMQILLLIVIAGIMMISREFDMRQYGVKPGVEISER